MERRYFLADADATARLGRSLSRILGASDSVCLEGDLGAGKSHLARSVIQALQSEFGAVEHVPSPTYTLIQTYSAGDLSILHADLYRLGDRSELDELGLGDALGRNLCLIEWPDRLGNLTPPDALWIRLRTSGDGRIARLSGKGWDTRLMDLPDA